MLMTTSHPGFFKSTAKQETGKSFIDVGGNPFHALTVAWMDSYKNTARTNDASAKILVANIQKYYPQLISPQPYLTAAERLGMVLNSSRKSELVTCLSYVFQQIAVDEIYANPLSYREVFINLDPQTPKNYLRLPKMALPVRALTALVDALGFTLTLLVAEHDKTLRKKERYTKDGLNASKFELVLQVLGNYVYPQVKNKDEFAFVGKLTQKQIEPVLSEQHGEETIASTVLLISEDNKRILSAYEQTRKILLTMVAAGEVSREQLIALFIEFSPKSNTAFTSSASFFAELEQRNKKLDSRMNENQPGEQETYLLASTLAGWISTASIDAEKVFARLDTDFSAAKTGVRI